MTTQRLPKPDAQFGSYTLADGSVIYPSGKDFERENGSVVKMSDAGKFMLWVKTGTNTVEGRKVDIGEFVMTKTGPRYFGTPLEALEFLEEERPFAKQALQR